MSGPIALSALPFTLDVKALAKRVFSRYAYTGVELCDVEQSGLLLLLVLARQKVGELPRSWEQLEPEIEREMRRVVRGGLFDSGKVVSLDAINENLGDKDSSEGGDLLDFKAIEIKANEFVGFIPQDIGGRFALINQCETYIRSITKDSTKNIRLKSGKFHATIHMNKRSVVVGSFDTVEAAKSAQRAAYKTIRDRCYPINLQSKPAAGSLRGVRQTMGFWRALAVECKELKALPIFMYWNPLDALIFLEDLSDSFSKTNDSAYALCSRDQNWYQRTKRGTVVSRRAA